MREIERVRAVHLLYGPTVWVSATTAGSICIKTWRPEIKISATTQQTSRDRE